MMLVRCMKHPTEVLPQGTRGDLEECTHFSPGGSSHRTPGLGHWWLCSCSSRCPWPGLSGDRGNGLPQLHKPRWCLLFSSRGHRPGTRSLQASGFLKLQGQVKDGRPPRARCTCGAQVGVERLSRRAEPSPVCSRPPASTCFLTPPPHILRRRQGPWGGGLQGDKLGLQISQREERGGDPVACVWWRWW